MPISTQRLFILLQSALKLEATLVAKCEQINDTLDDLSRGALNGDQATQQIRAITKRPLSTLIEEHALLMTERERYKLSRTRNEYDRERKARNRASLEHGARQRPFVSREGGLKADYSPTNPERDYSKSHPPLPQSASPRYDSGGHLDRSSGYIVPDVTQELAQEEGLKAWLATPKENLEATPERLQPEPYQPQYNPPPPSLRANDEAMNQVMEDLEKVDRGESLAPSTKIEKTRDDKTGQELV